jgi:murein DD-endopeptidase MepM/ murein hydrolase activator NlpD
MAGSKAYNIIVVPDDHGPTRQYRVTRRLIISAVTLLGIHLVVMSVFVATYAQVLRKARQAGRLEQENAGLREEVQTVEGLRQEVEKLTAVKNQVLAMLGVDASQVEPQQAVTEPQHKSLQEVSPELLGLEHAKAAESVRAYAPSSWPVDGYVSKDFFLEEAGGRAAHPGIDIVAPLETPVRAAGRGRVIEASYDELLGNYLVVDHGFGFTTLYGHNARLLVSVGQVVERGQVVALLGNTGRSSAPHLHFEVRIDGAPVDPRQYLTPR